MARISSRLGPGDWLKAGAKALASAGPDALKAEPLAVRLKVSKGSFYWHFRDVPAFQKSLLQEWEVNALTHSEDVRDADDAPVAQLRSLAQAFATLDKLEIAVRSWAQAHKGARRSVERIDASRLGFLQNALTEIGIANPEMARIIYAAAIGMNGIGKQAPSDNAAAIGSLVDLVLALR
ncbi:TetR family transcriptional regulator [Roseovarius rhodophyticola]|uniref:TetR family transcriptional regulator n=1 Tax=Roseovarius rhodophyticola TaxID=3080827 RepID=A0ABZ2TB22_9RHOB|nr:TetR family transcriptional regulator [Roseovarius sp. W115]MDV2930613.1 TetR family transcriptional regulator [Roseovarius sp. W115]